MKEQLQLRFSNLDKELGRHSLDLSNLQRQNRELHNQEVKMHEVGVLQQKITYSQQQVQQLTFQANKLQQQYQQSYGQQLVFSQKVQVLRNEQAQQQAEKNKYDSMFSEVDRMLAEYSGFEGVMIDPVLMVIKALPKIEPKNLDVLKEACAKKNLTALEELISTLDDVNAVDSKGMTLLHYALKHGFYSGVDKILQAGADVNVVDNNGCNALIYACTLPHLDYLPKILALTENKNASVPSTGDTPMHLVIAATRKILFAEELIKHDLSDGSGTVYFGGGTMEGITMGVGTFARCSSMSTGAAPVTGSTINQVKTKLLVHTLLEAGIDFNTQNNQGLTPFMIAYVGKLKFLVKLWLDTPGMINHSIVDKQGYYPIHVSALKGDIEGVKLMSKYYDINIKSLAIHQVTLFWLACQNGNVELVKYMLENGADPNIARADNNISPICKAMDKQHFQVVHELLGRDDIDLTVARKSDGSNLLHYCAALNKPEIAKKILAKVPLLDVVDSYGLSPLYLAIQRNVPEMVNFLLNNGANAQLTDKAGNSALHYSVGAGDNGFIQLLLDKGVNVNVKNANGETPIYHASMSNKVNVMEFLISKGADINIPNKAGFYPIHTAVHYGHVKIVELLQKAGVDINIISKTGWTPLQYYCNLPDAKLEVVKKLIDVGASIHCTQGNIKRTLLHTAAETKNLEIAEFLVNNHLDVGILTTIGFSSLYHACQIKDNASMVKLLIALKSDINLPGNSGGTPLLAACGHSTLDVVQELVTAGAVLDVRNKLGCSLICEAYYTGNMKVIKYLLSKGFDINDQCYEGKTCLHWILENKDMKPDVMMKVIQEFKGKYNLSLKDKEGRTAVDYAKEHQPELVAVLEQMVADDGAVAAAAAAPVIDDGAIAEIANQDVDVLGGQVEDGLA